MRIGSPRSVRRRGVATIALIATLLTPAIPADAAPAFSWHSLLRGSCGGGIAPAAANLTVILRSAKGKELDRTSTIANADTGAYGVCFMRGEIAPGRTLTIKSGPASRTITVPRVTLRVDRVTDVISGQAPAGMDIAIGYRDIATDGEFPYPGLPRKADAQGRFRLDYTSRADIRGGDTVNVVATTAGDDTFTLELAVAGMILRPRGGASADVTGAADATVTLRLRTAGGTLLASASRFLRAGVTGRLTLRKNGSAVAPAAGQVVTGTFATDARMRIPSLTITADSGIEAVSGTCFANQELLARNVTQGSSSYGTADGSGTFLVLLEQDPGDQVAVDCHDRHGDVIVIRGTSG
jgi:hypothetical protein